MLKKERAQSLQRKMKAAGIDSTITEVMTDKGKGVSREISQL